MRDIDDLIAVLCWESYARLASWLDFSHRLQETNSRQSHADDSQLLSSRHFEAILQFSFLPSSSTAFLFRSDDISLYHVRAIRNGMVQGNAIAPSFPGRSKRRSNVRFSIAVEQRKDGVGRSGLWRRIDGVVEDQLERRWARGSKEGWTI